MFIRIVTAADPVRLLNLRAGFFKTALLFLLIPAVWPVAPARAGSGARLAVLPLQVHAPQSLTTPVKNATEMLRGLLEKRGYAIIRSQAMEHHPASLLPSPEIPLAREIGQKLKADWIVEGSVTRLGGWFSLDLRAVDVSGRRPPLPVYIDSGDKKEWEQALEQAATTIDEYILNVPRVLSVEVAGNRRVESEALLAVIKTRAGQRLDQTGLNEDLRAVYRMGYFREVNIQLRDGPGGKNVIYQVVEKPSIAGIAFEGNRNAREQDLRKEISVKPYDILDERKIKEDTHRLTAYYQHKGYYFAQVESEIHQLNNHEDTLIYKIMEGERTPVAEISFSGNREFGAAKLRSIMATKVRGLFPWLTNAGYLDEQTLGLDIQKIITAYYNQGFIKVTVREPRIVAEKGRGLRINIEIEEGNQYTVDHVSVDGDLIRPAPELLAKLRLNRDSVYSREMLQEDVQALKTVYADQGYAYADITPMADLDDGNSRVEVTYRIKQGPKVRIGRINITGNTRTRDKVIRRALKLSEGDYYSAEALQKSIDNLRRLGYFDDVQIHVRKME